MRLSQFLIGTQKGSKLADFRTAKVMIITVMVLALTACSGGGDSSTDGDVIPDSEFTFEKVDAGNFTNPTEISNQWFPLRPGTKFVFEGTVLDEGEAIPHRFIHIVTDMTKVVDGVETVVIWDEDYADGELVESEIAFFAQDNNGVIWHFGEYPEEYEDGEFVDAPAWIAGSGESKAGIQMKVDSKEGDPSYSQGWAPEINWTDRARVYKANQESCVPLDCYQNVLVMEEFAQDEPGSFQLKFYAPGIGLVQIGWRGTSEGQEMLGLVEFTELDEQALAEVREAVLELEERAYEIRAEIYGPTSPIEIRTP